MANLLDRLRQQIAGTPGKQPAKPFAEQGVAGFVVVGGRIATPETNYKVMGEHRWRTASELLTSISIIAASLRYSLNLVARPSWSCDPADESDEAKKAAEFMDEVLHDTDQSWTRIVRRSAMYRYHGFQINEWVAKKRPDGKIGIGRVEARPGHTIDRWDIDINGGVNGVWQKDPATGREIYLPRPKLVYLVDDTLTDRPDGIGWFRHLVEPAERLKRYLKLEGIGFQRDLVGIPLGRAPLHKLNEMVEAGEITAAQRDSMLNGIKDFCSLETKSDNTGLVLDSQTYVGKTDTGEQVSQITEWGMELLSGDSGSVQQLGEAVRRLEYEMASIMGTASMLTGREGEGSRALSEDQSRNLYLTANATLADMAEAYDRDIVTPIWAMNGLPEELKPKLKVEDASFKDAAQIAAVLRDMATAGAILSPNDPAINDIRQLLGLPPAEEMSDDEIAFLGGKTLPGEEEEDEDPNAPPGRGGGPPGPKGGAGRARKYDPAQPRDPAGTSTGGQWASAGLATYSGDDPYRNAIGINAKLRAGEELTDDEEETLAAVRQGFEDAEPLAEPMTVYRGTGEHVHGTETDAIHPISTSRDIMVADEFATATGGEQPSVYQIEVPAGARVIDMVPHLPEGMKYQQEVLLEPGGKLIDLGRGGQSNGIVFRRLRYVPPTRKAFDPNQPRDPAGSPTGGQWTSAHSVRWHTAGDEYFANAVDRYLADPDKFTSANGVSREQVEHYISGLEERFRTETLPKDQTLWRGMVFVDGEFDRAVERGYIDFKKPVSFSSDVTEARDYSAREAYEIGVPELDATIQGVMLRVEGKKGDPAIHADPISGDDLKEYILPSGRFRITRVHNAGEDSPRWLFGEFERTGKAFNPDQPRHPKGTPKGGQWADEDAGNRAEQELQRMADFKRQHMPGKHQHFEEWLLENGEAQGPRVTLDGVRMGPKKMCYQNSFQAILHGTVDDSEWFYTEGQVLLDDIPILIDHAWLSNRKGEVLDLTLRGGGTYFGVPFEPDFVSKQTLDQGFYGLFSDGAFYQPITRQPVGTKRAWEKTGKQFNPNQPRHPAGSDQGGEWSGGGAGGGKIKHPKSFAELKADPRVESIDDYRPDGLHINLASGWAWSEQHSFGVETVSEALRLMRSVYREDVDKRFNPNQPRDPKGTPTGGQWTSNVVALTPELKRKVLVAPNNGKTIEEMHDDAVENQQRLSDIGDVIERDLGIEFDPPPPGFEVKTIDSAARKIRDEGYAGPHEITDWSRGSFIVDSPAEADKVLRALGTKGTVYDKGWKRLPDTNYLDRKVYLHHPNGGVSEIQITPRGVYQIKMGTGHRLYEITRLRTTPLPVARAANRKVRTLYSRAIRASAFNEIAQVGGRP